MRTKPCGALSGTSPRADVVRSAALMCLCLAVAWPSLSLRSQERAANLANVKEQEVKEKLKRLEEAMDRIAARLRPTEPYNAAKLERAFRESRRRLVVHNMDRVLEYLRENKLDRALAEQKEVSLHLEHLLRILLQEDIDPRELMRHIRRLKGHLKDLDGIIRDETREKLASDDAAKAGVESKELVNEQEILEDLIRRQSELEASVREPQDREQSSDLAKKQSDVQRDTDALRDRDVERERQSEKESRPSQPGRPRPVEPQGERPQPGERQPGEPQPGRPQPGDPQGGKPQPGESTGEKPPSEKPPKPGSVLNQEALSTASQEMTKAQAALEAGEGTAARSTTRAAREALEAARQSAREKLERLRLKRNFEKLQKDQDVTKEDTDKLADKMKEPVPLLPSEDGVPGRTEIQSASTDMQNASGQLGEGKAGGAGSSQKKALTKLDAAKEKVEESLERLQQALRDRLLAYLKDKFTKMLKEQRRISRQTNSLHLKLEAQRVVARTDDSLAPEIGRRERQTASRLAGRELELGRITEDVADLLAEDGTTLVFPQIIRALGGDLEHAASLLSAFEVGAETQQVQKQIEATIEEILKALEVAEKNPPPPNPNKGRNSQSGSAPLLPASAELKMVRSLQLRVNERTRIFDAERLGVENLTPAQKLECDAVRRKQKHVKDVLRKLAGAVGER